VSNRRYRLILSAVLRDGRWSGTVRGRRIEIERRAAADGRTIHWSAYRDDKSASGTTRQAKEALNACA